MCDAGVLVPNLSTATIVCKGDAFTFKFDQALADNVAKNIALNASVQTDTLCRPVYPSRREGVKAQKVVENIGNSVNYLEGT